MSRPLARALGCAQAVAAGDLSLDFHANGKDKIAESLLALKHMQSSLASVVGKVRENARSVATASAEIASGNLSLSSRTEEHAASLHETAASMEEVTSAGRQNADHPTAASSLVGGACETAGNGGQMMERVVETMQGISESFEKVTKIIKAGARDAVFSKVKCWTCGAADYSLDIIPMKK